MIETILPLAPELWATCPVPEPGPLQEQVATLRLENAALRAEKAALRARIRELEARLGAAWPAATAENVGGLGLLGGLGLASFMAVPLRARERTLGVVSLAAIDGGRRYDPADLALAEELARRAALVIDNARLHRELAEHEARLSRPMRGGS